MLRPKSRLAYFSNSADVDPGQGANEYVVNGDSFAQLSMIRGWRRILSNFYGAPVRVFGCVFPTVEHAFQGRKFDRWHTGVIAKFCVGADGSVPIGTTGADARRHRKMYTLTAAQLRVWDAEKDAVMATIRRAKFEQCELARRVLLATGDAELWHIRPRQTPIHDAALEALRAAISGE